MANQAGADRKSRFVYVGNWRVRPANWGQPPVAGYGFGICRYDADTGELTLIKSVFDGITVGQTCVDARRNILYCVHEDMTLPGHAAGGGGQVYAFAIDPATGDLTELNHQPSYGSLPAHVAVDPTGRYLIVPNHTGQWPVTKVVTDAPGNYRTVAEYDDATVVLFRLNADGSIAGPCDIHQRSGTGGPLDKQTHAQLHSVMMSPSGKLFAVCDKGNDEILLFRINPRTEKLELCGGEAFRTIPGGSVRYSAFHPTRPWFFANYETRAVVSSFRYSEDGRLEPVCTASALPEGTEDSLSMLQSDIQIHPSGTYLYSLVRGIQAASVFGIDQDTGEIRRIQTVTLDGTGLRSCAISPDGRFLLVAALASAEVLVWSIGHDGKLSPTGRKLKQPHPGTITFFPA